MQDLTVDTTDFVDRGEDGRHHVMSASLGVSHDERAFNVMGSRRWTTGAVLEIEVRVDELVQRLVAGKPYLSARGHWKQSLRRDVEDRLGRPNGTLLMVCRDPRIVRVATAATFTDPDVPADELGDRLGEPAAFIERLRHMYGRPACETDRWRVVGSGVMAAMFEAAAANDGLARYSDVMPVYASSRQAFSGAIGDVGMQDEWRVEAHVGYHLLRRCPCAPSRPPSLVQLQIREPDGPVCLACGRDRSGTFWPLALYDDYVVKPTPVGRRSARSLANSASPVEVRHWAHENGFRVASGGGSLGRAVVDAWNREHPERPYDTWPRGSPSQQKGAGGELRRARRLGSVFGQSRS